MKKSTVVFAFLSVFAIAKGADPIVCNPIDLNYKFQPRKTAAEPSFRECADPVCELFGDKYYLFASKSYGYWSSPDLATWTYIPSDIAIINDYAPTVMVYNGEIYFTTSSDGRAVRIFKTATPDDGYSWQEIDCKLSYKNHDPAFFVDDDGRVYFYWGCSDRDPIMGVEVDPNDGFREIGEAVKLIDHHTELYGWEVPGDNNNETWRIGWNEGPCMIKHNGRYLLQYAAPGTQYRIYADGVYVSDNPLGPYEYYEDNPVVLKPGGFIGGAGHGHSFYDRYGNLWHVASMKISQCHTFERRLGLFPMFITDDGDMESYTTWTDHPFTIPQSKAGKTDRLGKGWRQLAKGKTPAVSSESTDHPAANLTDENVETWWAAATGNAGEYATIDLGKKYKIHAVQVNLADDGVETPGEWTAPGDPIFYDFDIQVSDDGTAWETVGSYKNVDRPHSLYTFDKPQKARYVRVINRRDIPGQFSIYDLRVFGDKQRRMAKPQNFSAVRDADDARIYHFSWDAVPDADGYIISWGVKPGNLTHTKMVDGTTDTLRLFNTESTYYFDIEAY